MNLSVHKRYTKAPKITAKAFSTQIYLSYRQRNILNRTDFKEVPFIMGAGYNEVLSQIGIASESSDVVVLPSRGWMPKQLFGVDFGLPEPHPMEHMVLETIEDAPDGDAPWWAGYSALTKDPLEDGLLNIIRELKQDPEKYRKEYLHIAVPELPSYPEELLPPS